MNIKSIFHSAAVVLAVATTSPATAQTKLLLSTFFPPAYPIVAEVLVPWSKAVGTATQDRVTVEMASASLAPPPGQLAADGLQEVGNRDIDGVAALEFYRDQLSAAGN